MRDNTTKRMNVYAPLVKVDEQRHLVFGVAVVEEPDRSGEIFDYASSKPYFARWSDSMAKTTGGLSCGNLREMHKAVAAGRLVSMTFDDDAKAIRVCAEVVDAGTWEKVCKGVLTGFSIGGDYVNRWPDTGTGLIRYTGDPSELSMVDIPCVRGATYEVLKADGATIRRAFAPEGSMQQVTEENAGATGAPIATAATAAPVAIQKDAAAAIARGNEAIAALKAMVAEMALLPGEPDTWALDDMTSAIRATISAKVAAEGQVGDPAAIAAAGGGPDNPGATTAPEAPKEAEPTAAPEANAPKEAPTEKPKEQTAEKTITAGGLQKALAETLRKALDDATADMGAKADAKIREALAKADAANGELRKSYDELAKRIAAIEALPAPVGEPIAKGLASERATGAPTLDGMSASVATLAKSGQLTPEAHAELCKQLAVAALLQR